MNALAPHSAETAALPPPLRARGRARVPFRMARVVLALMLREIATTYGRSAAGYLWAIAEPIGGIALLTVAFSLMLPHPALGTNFALFYASGYLPFTMFHGISSRMAQAIRFSRPLLAYPSVSFAEALIARLLLNALTDVAIYAVVLFGIVRFYHLDVDWNLPVLTLSVLVTLSLAAGIGTLNCYLMMESPAWERVWNILTRPLFLISGALFTFDMMPAVAQNILWWNPLIHCIGLMRRGLYPTYHGDYISVLYVMSIAAATGFFGLLLLSRHYNRLLES